MKKIKYFGILFLLFGLNIMGVSAKASASLSVNKSSVENGSKVTASVKVSGTAAWNIKIASSGATSGCTQKFADATENGKNTTKTFTVTCKATSIGTINFTLSGDISGEDGAPINVSGNKSVKVVAPREKSKNNNLKSLEVVGYEISPKFDKSVNEYSVSVPSTVEKITINATKEDSYSTISGTGEKDVSEGLNEFEIVVTSETGVSNSYKVKVNVLDQNPIEVSVSDTKYTVVKEAKNLEKPELFEATTVKIGEYHIPAFVSESAGYTLVGLKDEAGIISLFIYDDGKYAKFNEYLTKRLSLVFLESKDIPKGFTKGKELINEEEVDVYKKDDIILVYAKNLEDGKEDYYRYDKKNGTVISFDVDKYEEEIEDAKVSKYLIYGLATVSLGLFLALILVLVKNKNKLEKISEKLEEVKENRKKKNKDETLS